MRYSDNVDYLIASVVYLGSSTAAWARTPTNMARDLSLDASRLRAVLEGFPGLFRKSAELSPNGENYFSLQARYAHRTDYGPTERGTKIPPIETDRIKLIYDFIVKSADNEVASRRAWVGNTIAVAAAVVSSITAIIVAVIATWLAH